MTVLYPFGLAPRRQYGHSALASLQTAHRVCRAITVDMCAVAASRKDVSLVLASAQLVLQAGSELSNGQPTVVGRAQRDVEVGNAVLENVIIAAA